MKRRLLLIESHAAFRAELTRALEHLGFVVDAFAGIDEIPGGSPIRGHGVEVVDLRANGVREWLERRDNGENTIVLVSGPAESAASHGTTLPVGSEILCKPFSIRTLETRVLLRSGGSRDSRLWEGDPILETRDPGLLRVLARARRLARRDMPIVIEGELGTGRRVLAEAIHGWSSRAGHPFLTIERADLESVGPAGVHEMVIETVCAASRGTLLVVEPADFPARLQEVLLAGMRHPNPAPPRWLTIARAPLEQGVREGVLMLELQYRLDAARLRLPAFRDREIDRLELCRSLARRVARELHEPPPEIDGALADLLARDGFPGNRLGLESRLRSCLVRGGGRSASLRDLLAGESERPGGGPTRLPSLNLKSLERDTIVRALSHWDGNRTRASEALGISVRTLRNKIREYGLR